jgi:hypothetical protein
MEKRFYTSIEYNFRDKDGKPVNYGPFQQTSRDCEYAGFDHEFWHGELDLHHSEGVVSEVETDIECYLGEDSDAEFGAMDRVHISRPMTGAEKKELGFDKNPIEDRKIEIWGATDGGYAVVNVAYPLYHENFLIVGYESTLDAHEAYPEADIKPMKVFDWLRHKELNDPTEEMLENLDQQIIAYAMYMLGQDGLITEDLDIGYPLYASYQYATTVAAKFPLREKERIIAEDDLDSDVIYRILKDVLKHEGHTFPSQK